MNLESRKGRLKTTVVVANMCFHSSLAGLVRQSWVIFPNSLLLGKITIVGCPFETSHSEDCCTKLNDMD